MCFCDRRGGVCGVCGDDFAAVCVVLVLWNVSVCFGLDVRVCILACV